jgi:hypothetical protein
MKIKNTFFILTLLFSTTIFATQIEQQMVNLNFQFKGNDKKSTGKEKLVKSNLSMPFYQTAELEKKINNKNYLLTLNPKKGKNPSEVEILVQMMNKKGTKIIAAKEVVAKINQENIINMKGLTFKVTPEI